MKDPVQVMVTPGFTRIDKTEASGILFVFWPCIAFIAIALLAYPVEIGVSSGELLAGTRPLPGTMMVNREVGLTAIMVLMDKAVGAPIAKILTE